MSTVFASGITAIIAALFTSRLGVAGTLIGTALTPMLMTVGVAVVNAQIQKATNKISDLPTAVQGRLSTQRSRVPGTPTPGEPPEEPEPPASTRRRDRRTPSFFERLLSIPTYLREMAPSTRRRTLLTGAAAGLIAAVIGLGGVTVIETASGGTLSCTLYENCAGTSSGGETTERSTSVSRAFGGSQAVETQNLPADSESLPAEDQQQDVEPAPDVQSPAPGDQQYQVTPQGEDQPSGEEPTPPPGESPQQGEPAVEENPSTVPQDGSQQPVAPSGQ